MGEDDSTTRDRRAATLDSVRELYRRLTHRSLLPGDLISAENAVFPDHTGIIGRIHADSAEFETYFRDFAEIYAVFRGFSADEVILDVGAHWGYSALSMRRRGAVAKILSVEAMPWNAQALAVLQKAEQGRYSYVQAAATERTEVLDFYVPVMNGVANTGSASTGGTLTEISNYVTLLSDHAVQNPPRDGGPDVPQLVHMKVPGRTLDDIVAEAGVGDRVAAIKMDVEGHEAPALRGAQQLLRRRRPLLMVEGGNNDPGVVAVMTAEGYGYWEMQDGRLLPHSEGSQVADGFWLHPDHLDRYRQMGIV